MTTYAMFIKSGNGLVFKADASSLKEAYNYFSKLKDMPLKQFKKLFIVTEVKKLINKVKIYSLEVFGLEKKRLNWVW